MDRNLTRPGTGVRHSSSRLARVKSLKAGMKVLPR
nr:unnamed protein product [Callosobruchus chinensis]CAH7752234.1 unnamed protein product [Callosobruchus chinensis]